MIEGKDKLAMLEVDIPEAGDYGYCLKQRYVLYAQWTVYKGRETTDIRFLAVMSTAGRL